LENFAAEKMPKELVIHNSPRAIRARGDKKPSPERTKGRENKRKVGLEAQTDKQTFFNSSRIFFADATDFVR
jgi:hypothetical protein